MALHFIYKQQVPVRSGTDQAKESQGRSNNIDHSPFQQL